MKKIILLLLIILGICSCKQEVKDFGIVIKVELYNMKFSDGYKTKYKITIDKGFNAVWGKATLTKNLFL